MAALPIIGSIVGKVLDRVLPDKAANDAAKAELARLELSGELKEVTDQLDINLAEAGSKSVFVAGWRPFVGWVCGAAFAWAFVVQPFAVFALVACNVAFDPKRLPMLDLATMLPVLLGMLGLGALRSYDKANGVGGGH